MTIKLYILGVSTLLRGITFKELFSNCTYHSLSRSRRIFLSRILTLWKLEKTVAKERVKEAAYCRIAYSLSSGYILPFCCLLLPNFACFVFP